MKENLSERDICIQFITPALQRSGWDFATQIREEVTLEAKLAKYRTRQARLSDTSIESALQAA